MENKKETEFSNKISSMFSAIHKRYDFFNHFFSFGADFWWRYKLVNALTLGKTNKVLDMAAGTLDVSIAIAKKYPQTQILAGDICEDMLLLGEEKVRVIAQKKRDRKNCCVCNVVRSIYTKICGKKEYRALKSKEIDEKTTLKQVDLDENIPKELGSIDDQIKTQVMDAQEIPLQNEEIDVCTIAFGIRNVENRLKALQEMHRVLVVGGQLYILEFAPVCTPFIGTAYHFYIEKIMPKLVKLFTQEGESYAYLAKSIKEFPPQDEFVKTIKEAGFLFVKYEKLTFGTVTLYTAIKSESTPNILK